MKWISVKDRLPELYDIVIIATKKYVSSGTYHDTYWYDRGYDCSLSENNPVTHWMLLPEPPKKMVNDE